MKKISIEVDGKPYLIFTKDEKTELGIKGNTTPEKDEETHEIYVPNILIITRKNADVLFVLRGGGNDSFAIMIAQDLYDKFQYQWFEPLADNYRELLYVNEADYAKKPTKYSIGIILWNFPLLTERRWRFVQKAMATGKIIAWVVTVISS